MRALEVHTLTDASELNLLIVLYRFDRYFPAAVANGIVYLTESAASGCPLDCVSLEGAITVLVLVPLHFPFAALRAPCFNSCLFFQFRQNQRKLADSDLFFDR